MNKFFGESEKRIVVIVILFILSFLVFHIVFNRNRDYGDYRTTKHGYFYQNYTISGQNQSSSEDWLGFLGILSTIFAVFFVYTGFKIDSTKEKIDEAEKRIINLEKNIEEDIYEYARQLEYCMSFIIQKQFDKAIDSLVVLRNEPFVLKDNRKLNTCYFFLAHCFYEKSLHNSDKDRKKEDMALAVEYINQAIVDPLHPFRNEIINAFNELDK